MTTLLLIALMLIAAVPAASADDNTGYNIGQTINDYTGTALDGEQYSIESYRGKILLLDFMASW